MITRTTIHNNVDFAAGEIILIDKSYGFSSFGAVHIVRKTTKIKKVGHAGTLDPLATGLLIVCTGKKTKSIEQFQDLDKEYTGEIELGKRTPSMDAETEVIEEKSTENITEELIMATRDLFTGEISQLPPMYSAIKHNGKALYKYARKGRDVERLPRVVNVSEFEITGIEKPVVRFRIRCSKGTYIRVIADDFGTKLGCGAYLKSLRRTAIGPYRVEDALTPDEFRDAFQHMVKEV